MPWSNWPVSMVIFFCVSQHFLESFLVLESGEVYVFFQETLCHDSLHTVRLGPGTADSGGRWGGMGGGGRNRWKPFPLPKSHPAPVWRQDFQLPPLLKGRAWSLNLGWPRRMWEGEAGGLAALCQDQAPLQEKGLTRPPRIRLAAHTGITTLALKLEGWAWKTVGTTFQLLCSLDLLVTDSQLLHLCCRS